MKPVRKAVLPVAGFGTRVLPATKAVPKEMLTVFDRPALQYVGDEAREAGIEHFVFITGRGKDAIPDYFDHQVELELQLRAKGKIEMLDSMLADLPKPGEMSFLRQMSPLGLGHAIWCAREVIGDEPFAVMLPDVIIDAERSGLGQLVDAGIKADRGLMPLVPAGTLLAGAHDHQRFVHPFGRGVYVHSGSWNEYLTLAWLHRDEAGRPHWVVEQIPVPADGPADPELALLIKETRAKHLTPEDMAIIARTIAALGPAEAALDEARATHAVARENCDKALVVLGNLRATAGSISPGLSTFAGLLDGASRAALPLYAYSRN